MTRESESTPELRYDTASNVYHTRYSADSPHTPATTVLLAVAEAKEAEPLALDPLYSVIDPDTLNDLIQSTVSKNGGSVRLTFRYEGFGITIASDGLIRFGRRPNGDDSADPPRRG